MQSAQPNYITSQVSLKDPETGEVLYEAGTPIPYDIAVRHGLIGQRARHEGTNTARVPQANRLAPRGGDR